MLQFYSFGVHSVIRFVSADKFDVHRAKSIGDGGDETVVVAFDVEDHAAIFEDAGAAELRFDVRGLQPHRVLHLVRPGLKRLLGVRVLRPEVT